MRTILIMLSCAANMLLFTSCSDTERTSRIPHDNSETLKEIDKKLQIAKDNTKKAHDDLKKTQGKLRDTQKKISKASGEEKIKLEKAAQDLKEALAKYDKKIKERVVQMIETYIELIDQVDANKRDEAYRQLPRHQYQGDILKAYFSAGNRPDKKDLEALEYEELNKIETDLSSVVQVLYKS